MRRPVIDFSSLRILVVENHVLMRRLLHEMLHGFGAREIREARNAPQAIDHIYSEAFDLVILDFFLGDMDGADFAWVVRHHEDCINREAPILLITGIPDHHKVLKARDAGINGMMAKPIAPKDLYGRIHSLLANPLPFVIMPDYAGPRRGRGRPAARRPAARRLMRPAPAEIRRLPPGVDPADEDRILL